MTIRRIRDLFANPQLEREDESRLARILNDITLWGMPVLLLYILVRMLMGYSLVNEAHGYAVFMALVFLFARLSLQRGYIRPTLRVLLLLAWGGVTGITFISRGLLDGPLIGYMTITLVSGLLLGPAEAFLYLFLSLAAIWGFAHVEVLSFDGLIGESDAYAFARNLTINFMLTWLVLYFIITALRKSLEMGDLELRRRRQTEAVLQQQAIYLQALHETTLGIVNRLELRPLLESILTRACSLVGTENALIELVVPDGSALRLELGRGIPAPYEGHLTYKGRGLTGLVWATGMTQFVNDYSTWEHRDLEVANQFHAMVGLPLKIGTEVIGVLALLCVDHSRKFDPEQVALLERFASLASIALQNARLYEATQKELAERRAAQHALYENEEKFRKVFQTSPVAICITNLEDGRLLEANYAYWDLTGMNPADSLGKTAEELKLWDTVETRNKFVELLKRKGSYYDPDDSFLDAKGNLKRVISFYELVRIGEQDRIIAMFYDMSAQKQIMDALKESEARTRALLAAIPDMILELTRDGSITSIIPPKGLEAAMPMRLFSGKTVGDLLSESVAAQTLFAVERSLAAGQMTVFEFDTKMGREYLTLEARVVPNSSNTVLMIVRDVTQRKWAEKEREKLIGELEEKNTESETLRNSLAGIVTTFDLEVAMERLLDQMKHVIPYDTASIWRVDGGWQTLIASRDLPPEISLDDLKFRVDDENSSRPILVGEKPFVLNNNVQEELADFKGPHSYIRSWLAVPLKIRGNIIGLIALDGRRRNQFNLHHAELAVAFADQLAIALDNASLFANLQAELEERRRLIEELQARNVEAETMRESLASIVGTFEFSEIIQRILDQIQLVVPYDSASIWKLDGSKQVLIGQRGLPVELQKDLEFQIDSQNHAVPIFNGELPYIISGNVQEDPAFARFHVPPHTYILSWLGVPLKTRGQIIGLIALDGRRKDQFDERHAALAVTFANQVAIAFENARLFSNLQTELEERKALIAELQMRNIESETLRESAAIVAATLEKNEAIRLILEQLERVVPFDSASVQLVSGNALVIVSEKGFALENEEDGRFEINESEPAYPVLTGAAPYILFDDIQLHVPAFTGPPHHRIHAWLAVPLKVKGQVLGIIALDGYTVGQFTERHAQLAVTYANQVAVALENARLYSDLQADLAIRQELISELEAKNAELERFTYTVSHDLKSPLFTIRGFLGYLEEDALAGNRERLQSDIRRITDATNKMQQLLNDLLELSRIGRLMNEPVEICFDDLAREAVELVHGRIMERGVAVHIDAGMPVVRGDKPRLIEVLQNLVDNAAKFMGDQPHPRVEIGCDGPRNGQWVFHVRDNGIGIAPEHHERIFGLFNKLDVKGEGTGIGLSLVKRIVEVHGGRIWVESEAGQGATFYFTLPVISGRGIKGDG
ncbi:MAG: GAF domain-containing protein [Chloroflexi bacterium]|nr:GAF domain-containing protein [Chloroflexota bacterium]